MTSLFTRLRFASVRDLLASASLAMVAAIVLDRVGTRGGGFFVGLLFGLAVGLGLMALGAWQRERPRV